MYVCVCVCVLANEIPNKIPKQDPKQDSSSEVWTISKIQNKIQNKIPNNQQTLKQREMKRFWGVKKEEEYRTIFTLAHSSWLKRFQQRRQIAASS